MKQTYITIHHKQLLASIALALALGLPVMPAYAQSPTVSVTAGARTAARDQATITRLKNRADAEITRRLTALNALLTKINAMVRLTSDQKTGFTNGIQGQITSLTNLRTKIDADTDIATLRTDVQSIVQSYRIFALYLPQVEILSHADRALTIIGEMNSISTKLQSRIDAAKSAGNDTTSLQSLMTDRTSKLADASTQAQNAINAVLPLVPSGYPGNKPTLQSARSMLQTARGDMQAAEKDATQVRQGLKGMKKPSTTPTATPTP